VAHFVRDTVRQDLDLSAIFASYREDQGYPLRSLPSVSPHPMIGARYSEGSESNNSS